MIITSIFVVHAYNTLSHAFGTNLKVIDITKDKFAWYDVVYAKIGTPYSATLGIKHFQPKVVDKNIIRNW